MWANYRIARAAMRYGHHRIGLDIFKSLTENVSSEHLHFWLVCLKEMSEAESTLLNDGENKISLVDRIDEAILRYNRAIAALKVRKTDLKTVKFCTCVLMFRLRVRPRTICSFRRNT